MSWLHKTSRSWGQIPFSDPTEYARDPYSRINRDNPRMPNKKDMTEKSPGMGTNRHSNEEISGDMGDDKESNSLSSFHEIENKLYEGQIMDEDPSGKPRPRTEDRGGPAVGDSPSVLGMEDDGYGSFILRHTPNDSTTKEVANSNLMRSLRNPARRVNLRGKNVNIL